VENALVLLDKLPGDSSIEETAVDFFQRWKIGGNRQGRGILYLYSKNENLFKIEVSYELESIFPDGLCHRLEEAARTYMLSEIPQDFLSELIITMNIRGQESNAELGDDFGVPRWFPSEFLSGGAGVKSRGYRPTLSDYRKAVKKLRATEGSEFLPSRDPQECVGRYLKSLSDGLGDPQLPLLTEGSQIYRMIVPRNEAQARRVYSYIQKALPYKICSVADLAVAFFRPGVANLPVVLRRSKDGLWYVDEPKAWTYFHRYEDSVECYPKYDDLTILPALRAAKFPTADRPIYRHRVRTPPLNLTPFSLENTIGLLENKIRSNPKDDKLYAELGEIYLFEINWITKAIEAFAKATSLAPARMDYHWRLYDLYINNSEVEKALGELRFISKKSPADAEAAQWLKYYTEAYRIKDGEFF
jgi:tetratricopeptide (TPR) repeat protein